MFRKSRKQQTHNIKRKRHTKKSYKMIKGAGTPGIFKWASSYISGDTLFGKTIYTIRKENYETDKIYLQSDFIRILNELYKTHKGQILNTNCDTSKLLQNVFENSSKNIFKQPVDESISKINNNKLETTPYGSKRLGNKISKNEFEDILHLIKKEYDDNEEKYDNEICKIETMAKVSNDSTISTVSTSSTSNNSIISEPSSSFCSKFQDITPRLTEPYKLVSKLGKGAYGIVYNIRLNGKNYAAKHINANTSDKDIQQIIDETLILKAISNKCREPGFVVCYEGIICENDKNNIYIINELLDNNYVEMFDFIYKNKSNITEEIVYNIIHCLCAGLLSIHDSNVAHRDIKPENVKVNISNNTIKYLDFGLSTKVDESGEKVLGKDLSELVGTPEYIDPLFHDDDDEKTFEMLKNYDYFSLALVIFELVVKHYKQTNTKFKTNFYNTPYYCILDNNPKPTNLHLFKFYKSYFVQNIRITPIIEHYNKNIRAKTPTNLYSVDLTKLLTNSYNRAKGVIPPK